jgi:hypothetical protein
MPSAPSHATRSTSTKALGPPADSKARSMRPSGGCRRDTVIAQQEQH